MFQGDLTADYTHTGYKQTVKHQRVFRAADYISSPAETDWCQSAAKSLLQVCGRHVIINNIMFIIPSLMLSGQLLYVCYKLRVNLSHRVPGFHQLAYLLNVALYTNILATRKCGAFFCVK